MNMDMNIGICCVDRANSSPVVGFKGANSYARKSNTFNSQQLKLFFLLCNGPNNMASIFGFGH